MRINMELNYERIGSRIKNIRKSRKLTQEALAEKVGLSSTQIYNIENAKSSLSLESLHNISSVLSISTDELLYGCVRYGNDRFYDEYVDLLLDCSDSDKAIILETAKTLKNELQKK